MPHRKRPATSITWHVAFNETKSVYSPQERSHLFRLLKAAAPPGASEALLQRHLYELDDAVRDRIQQYARFRDGRLDAQLKTAKALRGLEQLITRAIPIFQKQDVQRALIEEGCRRLDQVEQVLKSLSLLSNYSATRNERTPRDIRREGKRQLEDTILNEFLVIASTAWHHATEDRPKPNKDAVGGPGGPYAEFIMTAIAPLIRALDAKFIDASWSAIRDRLRKTIKIRQISLLNPENKE